MSRRIVSASAQELAKLATMPLDDLSSLSELSYAVLQRRRGALSHSGGSMPGVAADTGGKKGKKKSAKKTTTGSTDSASNA
jgi:hypothetical protein